MASLEVVAPPPPTKTYVLTLTEEEAQALVALTGNVAGTSHARTVTEKIYYALHRSVPGSVKFTLDRTITFLK